MLTTLGSEVEQIQISKYGPPALAIFTARAHLTKTLYQAHLVHPYPVNDGSQAVKTDPFSRALSRDVAEEEHLLLQKVLRARLLDLVIVGLTSNRYPADRLELAPLDRDLFQINRTAGAYAPLEDLRKQAQRGDLHDAIYDLPDPLFVE